MSDNRDDDAYAVTPITAIENSQLGEAVSPPTQVEWFGPYTAFYGYSTNRIIAVTYTAVYPENAASYTVPYYCAVWSKFTVKIRIPISIDLGIAPPPAVVTVCWYL
jgi:hypothetical protein